MAFWGEYISVAQRRAKAQKETDKLRKKGRTIEPVEIEGRLIARSFWGKRWCEHLESFSDYANRLPRGRTYVRNGSVCHLEIGSGTVEALVSGSSLYSVEITVKSLPEDSWAGIKAECSGQISSMLELLKGKFSDRVMSLVIDRHGGLFPTPREIALYCSCPDGARMCKHVAATLYGVGNRLDSQPELLFKLRQVDPVELLAVPMDLSGDSHNLDVLDDSQLSDIFGIDLDDDTDDSELFDPLDSSPRAITPLHDRTDSKIPAVWTGLAVAYLRQQLGLSVTQFAKNLGVTSASVYRWESASNDLQLRPLSQQALDSLLRSD